MRYFFHIAYQGTRYRGWQRQPNVSSVQETIETVLESVFAKKLAVSGCGRTDAEVHASQYFFHLDLEKELAPKTIFILNKQLPPDIVVYDIIPVHQEANARFDAVLRTYDYYIHRNKQPYINNLSSLYQDLTLELSSMQKALRLLTRYDDYRAFCKSPDSHNTTIVKFESAQLFQEQNDTLRIEFKANRYLKGMIRIIVFRLLEVGQKKMTLEKFENYLITKFSEESVYPAYPQGLYLSHIKYPYLDYPKGIRF